MAFTGTDCVRLHIIRRAVALGRESLRQEQQQDLPSAPLTQCHLSDLPCTFARCFHLAPAASHSHFTLPHTLFPVVHRYLPLVRGR